MKSSIKETMGKVRNLLKELHPDFLEERIVETHTDAGTLTTITFTVTTQENEEDGKKSTRTTKSSKAKVSAKNVPPRKKGRPRKA